MTYGPTYTTLTVRADEAGDLARYRWWLPWRRWYWEVTDHYGVRIARGYALNVLTAGERAQFAILADGATKVTTIQMPGPRP